MPTPGVIFLIVWGVLAIIAGTLVIAFLRKPRAASARAKETSKSAREADWDSLSIKQGRVDGQDISKHVRLGELLSIEGETMGGEEFQCIVSLAARGQADLIYVRTRSTVRRVKSGERGIVQIQSGSTAVINQDPDDALSISLQPEAGDNLVASVAKSGFSLALTIGTSLTEGTAFRYAARCSRISYRFIKVWDIPSSQSDEAILSRVSARADLAELAERIQDIQTATAFSSRHGTPAPLESGVCYILGEAGGRELSFIVLSEAALLIVPAFQPDMNLPQFLENLNVKSQMHARLVLRDECCAVAIGKPTGQYSLSNLNEINAVLSILSEDGEAQDVVRIEQDPKVYNFVTLRHLESPRFKNVLLWVVGSMVDPSMDVAPQNAEHDIAHISPLHTDR